MRSTRLAVVLAAIVVACGGPPTPSPSPTAEAYTITGTFTLYDNPADLGATVAACHGTGGYSDIGAGLGVVVRDQANVVLASSQLVNSPTSGTGVCRFDFTLVGIPRATFYSIEVGHRGALTYSFAEMVGKAWKVAAEIGS